MPAFLWKVQFLCVQALDFQLFEIKLHRGSPLIVMQPKMDILLPNMDGRLPFLILGVVADP